MRESEMTKSNRLTIEALDTLTPSDLRELPVSVLADLQKQLSDASAALERRKEILWTTCSERFAEQAQRARQRDARDTGTVHLAIDGFDVACSTSKRVTWDNAKLLAALDKLDEDDQRLYLKYSLSVPEEKFQHAPSAIKALFEPARTMKPTKEVYTLSLKDK